ncbi:pyridoxamine 5'-phosphate oxidase [Alteromonas aestuariivivens]|uniref:Pyridoxamine 5'-phosphate oxidase n=1 Tax=Alteromonas aestuariivivens TaxID=1938339 RepID=A0A3D8MBL7_9ALTE|nr:pyridoxamine 5'-phosphate oxidase family protein [Alteromonas aestuariivivens]RDV27416.1 pyridoxamine 5'-phosphate oxidase [Alteromonas aestuariivivens]
MIPERSWQQRLHASLTLATTPENRYFQMATCDEHGIPHNRTVVFRELESSPEALLIVSDLRTEKCQHLQSNRNVSGCWYFSQTREQYRFACQGEVLTSSGHHNLLEAHWQRLSEPGRQQYFRNQLHASEYFDCSGRGFPLENYPPQFCVIRLIIERVDYLSVAEQPHERIMFEKSSDGSWLGSQIDP